MTALEYLKDLRLVFSNGLTDAQKLRILECCIEGYILTEETDWDEVQRNQVVQGQ